MNENVKKEPAVGFAERHVSTNSNGTSAMGSGELCGSGQSRSSFQLTGTSAPCVVQKTESSFRRRRRNGTPHLERWDAFDWRACCFGLPFLCTRAIQRKKSSRVPNGVNCFGDSSSSGPQHPFLPGPDAIGDLKEGDVFANKYHIESGIVKGKPYIRYAKNINSKDKVVLKFYNSKSCFENSVRTHRTLDSPHVCKLLDVVEGEGHYPPCLVFEKGDYTLEEWLTKPGHYLPCRKAALFQIVNALVYIHGEGIVHGDLKPSNIMWFSEAQSWKLMDFDASARSDELRPLTYTLAYAAPEIILGEELRRDNTMTLTPAVDMWAFGVIAFEVITGRRFFGPDATKQQIRECLCLRRKLPDLERIEERQARRLVKNLLRVSPKERLTAVKAQTNASFRPAEDSSRTTTHCQPEEATQSSSLGDVRNTRPEMILASVTGTLTVEQLAADDLHCSFQGREGFPVFVMTLGAAKAESIFLLDVEKDYRIRVTLQDTYRHRYWTVEAWIAVKASDGEAQDLTIEPFTENGKIEAVALFEPRKNNWKLNTKSPHSENVRDKFDWVDLSLDLFIGLAINHEEIVEMVELKETMRCRMHAGNDHLDSQQL